MASAPNIHHRCLLFGASSHWFADAKARNLRAWIQRLEIK
jgi:hypothetical protein